ncbi:hypothetical protein H6P81_004552 [Aristolochia fimbriata]|uniref:Pentatricopeptide repeat-containing protein n=1 Tax=Aristolochia fimbriata TaxID=158543 RepID=A0AAV7FH72_ARIFI|nr:hypothetical protein H6P81_004552 [Aristolochia fimbriata]
MLVIPRPSLLKNPMFVTKRLFLITSFFDNFNIGAAGTPSNISPHAAAAAASTPLKNISFRWWASSSFYAKQSPAAKVRPVSSSFSNTRFASTSNTNSPVSFNFSDSEEEEVDGDEGEYGSSQKKKNNKTRNNKEIDKSKLPPPYDPFRKKPVIEEPKNPKNLQEVFHNMRGDGLMTNAVKMFDALSKDGLTHEALELFSQIKDKGQMPDVIAHTAVIEAYANAGQPKEALKVYLRMLASGVKPNAYTYTLLIKALAAGGRLEDAKKYLMEMIDKEAMRPNAAAYTSVFEAFVKEDKVEEGRLFLERMKDRGFVPDEKAVREQMISKLRGQEEA